ncbi:hypothetical protein [Bosea minatitlanensis]|uniref:Uncharacterized protein n=1 Tax=Bosea minatitlanensis TaxID=128782 RepID=A0ABW0F1B1_9HYPH|nr:hypothetical protein [Bosea minatitlanensis]MCT4492774.1 hypothetical protein [Bosea minatitlanensis]
MTNHTPGPWRMTLDDFGDYTIQPQHEELAIAAVVNGEMRRMGGVSGEHEANAHVIVAAPDLLKAAKRALVTLKAQGESVRPGNVLGALDAAIQKAEGRHG